MREESCRLRKLKHEYVYVEIKRIYEVEYIFGVLQDQHLCHFRKSQI